MFVLDIYIIQLQDGETVGNMVIQTILLVYNVDAMYGLRCLEKKSSSLGKRLPRQQSLSISSFCTKRSTNV